MAEAKKFNKFDRPHYKYGPNNMQICKDAVNLFMHLTDMGQDAKLNIESSANNLKFSLSCNLGPSHEFPRRSSRHPTSGHQGNPPRQPRRQDGAPPHRPKGPPRQSRRSQDPIECPHTINSNINTTQAVSTSPSLATPGSSTSTTLTAPESGTPATTSGTVSGPPSLKTYAMVTATNTTDIATNTVGITTTPIPSLAPRTPKTPNRLLLNLERQPKSLPMIGRDADHILMLDASVNSLANLPLEQSDGLSDSPQPVTNPADGAHSGPDKRPDAKTLTMLAIEPSLAAKLPNIGLTQEEVAKYAMLAIKQKEKMNSMALEKNRRRDAYAARTGARSKTSSMDPGEAWGGRDW